MKKPSQDEFRDIVESGDKKLLEKLAIEFPLSTRLALLDHKVRAKSQEPHTLGNPLRVFISYRWENAKLKWHAQQVAEYLRARGYDVFLDQDTISEHETLEEIVNYVSKIASTELFLVLATPGYIESISGNNSYGWVYDEYKYAMSLASVGKVEIVGVEIDGLDLSYRVEREACNPGLTKLDEGSFVFEQYIDFSVCFPSAKHRVRIPLDGLLTPLDNIFPQQIERDQDVHFDAIVSAIQQIDLSLSEGKAEHVYKLIEKHSSSVEVPELLYRKMICEKQAGNFDEAADIALKLSKIRFLDFPSLMKVIQVFQDSGRLKHALQLTLSFLRSISLGRRDSEEFSVFNQPDFCTDYYSPHPELVHHNYRKWAHWTVAEILYARGSLRAANNHLKAAYRLTLETDEPGYIKISSLFGFGQLCLENGHLFSARQYFLDALSISGADNTEYWVSTHNYLLVALWGLGEHEELQLCLIDALEKFPNEAVFSRIKEAVSNSLEAPVAHVAQGDEPLEESCSMCGSIFETDICSSCGSLIDETHDKCVHCDHSGAFPSGLLVAGIAFRCPICLMRVSGSGKSTR